MTRQQSYALWEDPDFGGSVRTLLALKDNATARLWFRSATEPRNVDYNTVTVGEVCQKMLIDKLAHFHKLDRMPKEDV